MKYFIMNAKNHLSGTPLTDFNTKVVWEYFVIFTQRQISKTFQISPQTTSEKYPFNRLEILCNLYPKPNLQTLPNLYPVTNLYPNHVWKISLPKTLYILKRLITSQSNPKKTSKPCKKGSLYPFFLKSTPKTLKNTF